MVSDKFQVRSLGPIDVLTGQPNKVREATKGFLVVGSIWPSAPPPLELSGPLALNKMVRYNFFFTFYLNE